MGSMAVYLDDCSSGARVYGNIFVKTPRAVFMGGGRDHLVENNIFVDCTPAVHFDGRGLDTRPVWHDMIYKTMKESLLLENYLAPPYITRYPELGTLKTYYEAKDETGIPPENVRVLRNISVRGRWLDIDKRAQGTKVEIQDNLTDTDPLFEPGVFRLQPNSPALKLGFKQIPTDQIGPRH